ncbi:IS630 family transposase, partial [Vibrio parahaemolyticus]|nr:IS630 family transposase [Vibrio parahaemolyticus]
MAVTEEGRHAVVVMDGAGWHTEEIASDFEMSVSSNFHLIPPELNSIEQVWRWLRQHYLFSQS